MPSSLIHNSDCLPNIPTTSAPLRSRTSSLLPIPTRRETSLSSSLRSSSNSSQPSHSPTPGRTRGISTTQRPPLYSSQYSASGARTPTRLPSRQPSFSSNHTPLKPTPPSPKRILSSASSSKPVVGASAGLKKLIDKVNKDQANHFRDLTKSFSQVPCKTTTISTVSITTDKPYPSPTSLTSTFKAQRSGARRPAILNAVPSAPALCQVPLLQPSATVFQKTRTVRSYQELYKQPAASSPAGPISRATKQLSPHLNKANASPESLQSKITLTDGGSSIRINLEYPHYPSVSCTPVPNSKVTISALGPNTHRCPTDVYKSPPALSSSLASLEYPEPQKFQSRADTLEKLRSLIGMDELQALVNLDALYQLISRSDLYETQLEIQERIFKESTPTPDGQKLHALALFPQVEFPSAVPRATLKATAHPIPSLAKPVSSKTSSIPPLEVSSAGLDPSPKKSNYVGNILLEKLGWKSISSNTQNSKHGRAKSIGKSLRPSSFILTSSSIKGKLPGQQGASAKPSTSEQRRFSQILGAKLETLNCSTCVVMMGERYHVLPVLPFNVIEEIYRRGMQTSGIMRISGDLDRIDELVNKFESCPKIGVDVSGEDIHTLCGLLKHYLRTLPEPLFHPLLSHILWKLCVEPSRIRQAEPTADEHSLKLLVARYLLNLLPSRALSLLTYVIRFLAQIPFFAENRIQHDSLAVMLGPAIFVPRDIGLPGLGLHPRRNNGQTSTISWRSSTHTSVSFIKDVDKTAVSQRAAESTLWLMNHSTLLFDGAGKPRESALSSPQDVQQATPHQFFPNQFIDTSFPEQITESPPNSPSASILTYASDLTVSQRSTIHEESPELLPSSSIHVDQSPPNEVNKLDEFGHGESTTSGLLDKPEDRSRNTSKAGLGLEFPSSLDKEVDSALNDVIEGKNVEAPNQLDQSPGAVAIPPEPTTEQDQTTERQNSTKSKALLTQHMEVKQEMISEQESLIESLVEETGRLGTGEEREATLPEHKLLQAHIKPVLRKKVIGKVKSDPRDEQRDLKSPETSPGTPNTNNKYIDYHEQMFNFSPSAQQTAFVLSESCSSGMSKGDVQDEQSESESLSSDSTALDPVSPDQTPDRRLSKNRLFGGSQEYSEDDAIEELRPSTITLDMDSLAFPSQIRRSIGTPHPYSEHSERELHASQSDDDYDSDHSNAASLRSEISRLKSINSNLIHKLKSIESIIGDVSFS